MSTTAKVIRNGVDTEQLFGTLDAIKADPSLARFQFRARNRWIDGAHNRTTIRDLYAANQEDTSRAAEFVLDAGEPAILLGTDTGPNPVEYLLHALAACLTTSLVYVAAARGVHLTEVESTLEGDMDVQGALGLSDELPQRLRADPRRPSASPATRRRRSCARSSCARSSARPSSTWSRTASPSRWTWRLRDPDRQSGWRPRAGGCQPLVAEGETHATCPQPHHRSDARARADRGLRRCHEHACERRRARHLLGRRQAVGDDRHRFRVGVRRPADRPRLARLCDDERARDHCGGSFGVSILAEDSSPSPASARSRARPSSSSRSSTVCDASSDSPVIAGGLAHLDCELSEGVQVADHTVLFGRVRAAPASAPGRRSSTTAAPTGCSADRVAGGPSTERKPRMSFELTARTDPGARLVALAEALANEIGPRAAKHDRDGSFPFDSLAAVRQSGYFAAPVPEQLGGLGVTSVHDLLVCVEPARPRRRGADPGREHAPRLRAQRRAPLADRDRRRAKSAALGAFAETLEEIARQGTRLRLGRQRDGQDLTRPTTTATRTETGWIVSGHKVFCTMSPAADVLYTAVTYTDGDGRERYGYAMVPRQARRGRRPRRLGRARHARLRQPLGLLRGACGFLPSALRGGFPDRATRSSTWRETSTPGSSTRPPRSGSPRAHTRPSPCAARASRRTRPACRCSPRESLVDLSACRAVFSRAAALIDEHHERNPTSPGHAPRS